MICSTITFKLLKCFNFAADNDVFFVCDQMVMGVILSLKFWGQILDLEMENFTLFI